MKKKLYAILAVALVLIITLTFISCNKATPTPQATATPAPVATATPVKTATPAPGVTATPVATATPAPTATEVVKPIVLKFSDPSPANTARTRGYEDWGKWLEQRTNGKVRIQWYWSESLAKARDNVPATQGGVADMCTNSSYGYHPSIFPIWQFSELPFLGPADWYSHSMACKELYFTMPELKKELDDTGLKIIGMFGVHPSMIMSKKPITKLEDLKGLKIKALGPAADWLKAVGATPVTLTIYETYEALQKGTIDAAQTYVYTMIPYKFPEVTKYLITPGWQNITVEAWMNGNVWKKLPTDIQAVFEGEGWDKMVELVVRDYDGDYDKSVQAMKDAGMQISEITGAEWKRWEESGKVAQTIWFADMQKRGIDGNKIIQKYNEAYQKYPRKGK